MAKKSADELVDELAGRAEEIRQRATEEARIYIAKHMEELFLGGPKVSRHPFGGESPADCIYEFLADHPSLQKDALLTAAKVRFDEDMISEDFLAGVLFACRLFADPDFDY
ncbi:hypothetical protein [Nocardia salmonicida]|uniref:hypothetical protein n=1 Tax=Nocardia salmonicida TaxID=53431 RepID=UPI003799317C